MIHILCPKCRRNPLQIRFRYQARWEYRDWLYDWDAFAKMKRSPQILKTNIHTTAHAYCTECKVLIEVMGWQVPDNPEGGLEQAFFEALNEKVKGILSL